MVVGNGYTNMFSLFCLFCFVQFFLEHMVGFGYVSIDTKNIVNAALFGVISIIKYKNNTRIPITPFFTLK